MFALFTTLLLLWGISLVLRDASIIDVFWGPAFVLVTWLACDFTPPSLVVASLVTLWGLRLGGYLFVRNRGHGEDKRYVAMRTRHGESWWWKSAFMVFGFQGALVWVVSLPVRAAVSAPFAAWGYAGAALFIIGLAFEAVGDAQLMRFKSRPENRGVIMRDGLWRYTRHPNYFGDCLVWWGFGVFGLATGAWWTLAGPLVMTVLLVRVSGKDLLEADMMQRPGYAEYAQATSGFVPWRPR